MTEIQLTGLFLNFIIYLIMIFPVIIISLNKKNYENKNHFISIVIFSFNSTLSLSDDKAYEILKENIIKQANLYIVECESNMVDCYGEYKWENNNTSFLVSNLLLKGYFKPEELINPINKKDISDCMIIDVNIDENKLYTITLDDKKC